MTMVAEESWANVRTVKAFSNEGQEVEKFVDENDKVYKLGKEKAYYQSAFGLVVQVALYGSRVTVMYVSSKLY